jgi:hypothetical protein
LRLPATAAAAVQAWPKVSSARFSHQARVSPLRLPLLTIVFLCLALDATGEGALDSPFSPVGRFLLHNLNRTVPIDALALPLFVMVLCLLLLVHLFLTRTETIGHPTWAWPMGAALAISLLTVVAECAYGYWAGGDMKMAKNQVQTFVTCLMMAYLVGTNLRGPRDHRLLGVLVLAAACCKSTLAIWIHYSMDSPPNSATIHGDSILFACAATLVVARFLEQPNRRTALLNLTVLPLIIMGMIANNRRIVWVEMLAGLVAWYLVSRRSRLKRMIARVFVVAVPVAALYVAVGWNSNSRIFAPVSLFHSMGDSDIDASTLFRDVENYNLLQMLRNNPIIGSGFGHPFVELIALPDISFYKEYHFMPHNSLLGLWCFTGWVGFTGLSIVWVTGIFLAARGYYWARSADERVAAVMALAMIVIFLVHGWGDIGFSERETVLLVGPALAIAGQVALSTGGLDPRPRLMARS